MQVVIVGAGPAGLAAAAAAREAGVPVRLLDASDQTGGQYWRHLPSSRPAARERVLHHRWAHYVRLRTMLERDPQVRIDLSAHVWAVETVAGELRLHVVHGAPDGAGRRSETIAPDQLVLATGAHDRALPIPGWTLPGVFTAGAAQAMAKSERVAVGRRVVVAGSGPFLFPVTVALGQVDARVVSVLEAARPRHMLRSWLRNPLQLLRLAGKTTEFAGYVRHLLWKRIRYRTGRAVTEIHGTDAVEAVTVAALDESWRIIQGTEQRIECDAVCLGHGFTPRLELAVAAGCRLNSDRFVETDLDQATSVQGVWAAGEITGIGGADLAEAEGYLAGWNAAGGAPDATGVRRAQKRRNLHRSFADRLDAAHSIRAGWTTWLRGDTVVCRCEEVDLDTLTRVAQATESSGLRSLKLTTRAGLGACQGRVCGRNVEHLLAEPLGLSAGPATDRRPVASPLRLGELAALDSLASEHNPPRKETDS